MNKPATLSFRFPQCLLTPLSSHREAQQTISLSATPSQGHFTFPNLSDLFGGDEGHSQGRCPCLLQNEGPRTGNAPLPSSSGRLARPPWPLASRRPEDREEWPGTLGKQTDWNLTRGMWWVCPGHPRGCGAAAGSCQVLFLFKKEKAEAIIAKCQLLLNLHGRYVEDLLLYFCVRLK